MEMIRLTHVAKRFGQHIVFDDFSYVFEKGKFYAITGESGSGKSTLLHMIGGLESYHEGSIVMNQSIPIQRKRANHKLWRDHISFIFQNYALIDKETVNENLKMVTRIQKEKNADSKIKEALHKVGLYGCENKPIFTLSGGEQQRVALARVLLKKADIILADEPTGNLDMKNRNIIFQLLKSLQQEGKTIIMVTHDMELARQCDEILHLSVGRNTL